MTDKLEKAPRLDALVKAFKEKTDGWQSVVTGLGTARDKRMSVSFRPEASIAYSTDFLNELYRSDDLVATTIDLPAVEQTREWIEVTVGGDDGSEKAAAVMQKLDALHAQAKVTEGMIWGRLFGGALVIIGAQDGQEVSEPLNLDRIQSVDWLNVVERSDIQIRKYYTDPKDPKFGQPETYSVTIQSNEGSVQIVEFHETRTIRFDGTLGTRQTIQKNSGWTDSVLQRTYPIIRDFQAASGSMAHILQDFSQSVYKIEGLSKMLSMDKENLIIQRLINMDLMRSMVRAIPMDTTETFEDQGRAVTGLDELIDRQMMRVSTATRIPVTLLFGRSPAGMNATGESDIRLFYDHIKSLQETSLRPRLEYLLQVIMSAANGPTNGEPEVWSFDFNPLFQPTEQEESETRLNVAKADEIYINTGVLSPNEVADSRFGGGEYSMETTLDDETRNPDEGTVSANQAAAQQAIIAQLNGDSGLRIVTDSLEPTCGVCKHRDGNFCLKRDDYTTTALTCDSHEEG